MSRKKCREMLVDGITKVAKAAGTQPTRIVVQRDGRMFESEIEAARDALDELKRANVISVDANLTCIEIPKSGAAAFRLFDEFFDRGTRNYRNPEYGTFTIIGPNEGFVCNTGLSFRVPGTVRPLHVKRVHGDMPIEECLEDIFYLACLTWSKPDGCARDPVTVRLNDRQLIDVATPFDDEDDEAPRLVLREAEGGAR
jgi:argonaute-like protein implicated in RNA metabolism and viral defense